MAEIDTEHTPRPTPAGRGVGRRRPGAEGQSESSSTLADRLGSLSDGVRLRLLRLLELEELSVGEIARVTQLPQSTVSRQLKVLAGSSWLARRSAGTATYYRMTPDDLEPGARQLWATIRDQFGADPRFDTDLRRLRDVLAARRTDSSAFFGRVAGEWDAYRRELFGEHFGSMGLLALLGPDWVVADLGCGTGDLSELLSPHVERVIAVDESQPMLDAARGRLGLDTGARSNIELVHAGIERLPLPDDSVDAVCCSLVLHHIEDPRPALREMARVLRPDRSGGLVLIIDMLPHEHDEYRTTMGHKHQGFDRASLVAMYADAGFETPRIVELPSDPESKGPGLFTASARLAAAKADRPGVRGVEHSPGP